MLRAVFLSCALILPALFASAIAGHLDFGAENIIADNAQIPLDNPRDHHDHRLVCQSLSRNLSPASQVFHPGTVFVLFSELLPNTYVDPQALLNSRKTSLIGPTQAHRHPRAPCGQAQQKTSAQSFVIPPSLILTTANSGYRSFESFALHAHPSQLSVLDIPLTLVSRQPLVSKSR